MGFLRRNRFKLVVVAATAYLVLCSLAAVAFVELSLRLPKRPLSPEYLAIARDRAVQLNVHVDQVEILSRDGLRLRGWFVRPQAPNRSVVMLFHGLTDNRLGMAGFAELFLRHGYGVLMPDSRTHGESDGVLATYGVAEADDVRRWVDWLYRNQSPQCVYGFGESMGAAIVLQSLTQERRFCAVIAESAFADFREAVYDRIGEAFSTGPWLGKTLLRPAVESAFVYARWKYDVDFSDSSPRQAVAATSIPVMLIHGELDPVIRLRNSQSIHAANTKTILWSVPAAYHCGAWSAQPKVFEQRVLAWFAQHRT